MMSTSGSVPFRRLLLGSARLSLIGNGRITVQRLKQDKIEIQLVGRGVLLHSRNMLNVLLSPEVALLFRNSVFLKLLNKRPTEDLIPYRVHTVTRQSPYLCASW